MEVSWWTGNHEDCPADTSRPGSVSTALQAAYRGSDGRPGITTYSPLVHFGAKAKGVACTTGVIGFGGLGHMAVKLAKTMVGDPATHIKAHSGGGGGQCHTQPFITPYYVTVAPAAGTFAFSRGEHAQHHFTQDKAKTNPAATLPRTSIPHAPPGIP
jgi:hypothetical protein